MAEDRLVGDLGHADGTSAIEIAMCGLHIDRYTDRARGAECQVELCVM